MKRLNCANRGVHARTVKNLEQLRDGLWPLLRKNWPIFCGTCMPEIKTKKHAQLSKRNFKRCAPTSILGNLNCSGKENEIIASVG